MGDMTAAPSTAVGSRAAGQRTAQQIYVTHCTQADSIRHQPGFGLRAASTDDPALLKFALDFPSYELPLDMWGTNPLPQDAPRRLALTAAPGNRLALVHTAFVQYDTRGRPGSYFTHVLVYDRLSPADALRSWGSTAWVPHYPEGNTQNLDEFVGVPGNGPINDDSLRQFLSGSGAEGDLATRVISAHLRGNAEWCRELLAQALLGCLEARACGGERGRFYLLAEPGLCALLLYGVCRLAPPGWLDDLTFSTYETAHGGLRQLKVAQVAATYLKNPQKGLDADCFAKRGFGLDTFARGRCSDELRTTPPGVGQLVRLVTEGKWNEVEEWKRLAAGETASVAALENASALSELGRRLRAGKLTPADLHDRPGQVWQVLTGFVREGLHEVKTQHLPPECRAAALLAAASDPARAQEAAGVLGKADDNLVRLFCAWFNAADPQQQAVVLGTLFGPQPDPGLFECLLRNGVHLAGKVPDDFLARAISQGGPWSEHWLGEEKLGVLLGGLRECPEAAARVWTLYAQGLTQDLLLGNVDMLRQYNALEKVQEALGSAVPPDAAQALDDWRMLQIQLVFPQDDPGYQPAQLEAACRRRGLTSIGLLGAYFNWCIKDKPPGDPKSTAFLRSFAAFFPHGESAEVQQTRTGQWLQVLQGCPEGPQKECYQVFFIQQCVSDTHRRSIAKHYFKNGLLSREAYEEFVKDPPRAETAPTAAPAASVPAREPAAGSGGRRQHPDSPGARKSWPARRWVLVGAGALVALALLAIFSKLLFPRAPRPAPVARGNNPATSPQDTNTTKPSPIVSPTTSRPASGGTPPTTARKDTSPPPQDPRPNKEGNPPVDPMPDPPLPRLRLGDAEAARLLMGAMLDDLDRTLKDARLLFDRNERGDSLRRLQEAKGAIEKQLKEIDKIAQGATDEGKAEAAVQKAVRAVRDQWEAVAGIKHELHRLCLGLDQQKRDAVSFLNGLVEPPGVVESARSRHQKARWFLFEGLRCEVRKCRVDKRTEQALERPFEWLVNWNPGYIPRIDTNQLDLARLLIDYLVTEEVEFPEPVENSEDVSAHRDRLARFLQGPLRPVLGKVLGNPSHEALKYQDEAVKKLSGPPGSPVPKEGPPPEDSLPVAVLAALLREDVKVFRTDLDAALKRAGEAEGVLQALYGIGAQERRLGDWPPAKRQEKAREEVLRRCREIEKIYREQVGKAKEAIYRGASPERLPTPADRVSVFLTDWAERQPSTREFLPALDDFLVSFVHYDGFVRCNLQGEEGRALDAVFHSKSNTLPGMDTEALFRARQQIRRELIDYFAHRWTASDLGQAESRGQLHRLVQKLNTPLDPKKPRSAPLLTADPLLREDTVRHLLGVLSRKP
jgi:hypothetical protein